MLPVQSTSRSLALPTQEEDMTTDFTTQHRNTEADAVPSVPCDGVCDTKLPLDDLVGVKQEDSLLVTPPVSATGEIINVSPADPGGEADPIITQLGPSYDYSSFIRHIEEKMAPRRKPHGYHTLSRDHVATDHKIWPIKVSPHHHAGLMVGSLIRVALLHHNPFGYRTQINGSNQAGLTSLFKHVSLESMRAGLIVGLPPSLLRWARE